MHHIKNTSLLFQGCYLMHENYILKPTLRVSLYRNLLTTSRCRIFVYTTHKEFHVTLLAKYFLGKEKHQEWGKNCLLSHKRYKYD